MGQLQFPLVKILEENQTNIRTEQVKGGRDPSELPSGFDYLIHSLAAKQPKGHTSQNILAFPQKILLETELPVLSYPVK